MEVDIKIGRITGCLMGTRTREEVETEYKCVKPR